MRKNISKILKEFRQIEEVVKGKVPYVSRVPKREPFKILISCLLSLRTKDRTTREAAERLFLRFPQISSIAKARIEDLERLIYPVGFYKVKARRIKEISRIIIRDFSGRVPSQKKELLRLKGIGRKCANLILSEAFGKREVCVDTHVHRISNRIGWVKTDRPEASENILKEIFPKNYWSRINRVLVSFGQNICRPLKPLCFKCPVEKGCYKVLLH